MRQCAELFIDAKTSAQLALSNSSEDPAHSSSDSKMGSVASVHAVNSQTAGDGDISMETDGT